jgi:hypothetical protein
MWSSVVAVRVVALTLALVVAVRVATDQERFLLLPQDRTP